MDTKKNELVGAFKNAGRTWRPKGKPHRVNVHVLVNQKYVGYIVGHAACGH